MTTCRPPSSFGNLACRPRNDEAASASVFCDESCTRKPPDDPVELADRTGAVAVRVRVAGGGLESLGSGSSQSGPPELFGAGAAARGAADAGPIAGRPLGSLPSGRMGTVRTLRGSVEAPEGAAGADGAAAGPGVGVTGVGSTTRGAPCVPRSFSATGSSCLETTCSLLALATRSCMVLPDCASPAVGGTIFAGVAVSAVITGGGCATPG